MSIVQTWNRALSLMVIPTRTWRLISIYGTGRGALGFLVFCSIIIGLASSIPLLMENRYAIALRIGTLTAAILIVNSLIVTLLTRMYASRFDSAATIGRAAQVTIFSLTPSFIGLALIALSRFNILYVLIFGVYSVSILYKGLYPMLATPKKYKTLFTTLITFTSLLLSTLGWLVLQRLQ